MHISCERERSTFRELKWTLAAGEIGVEEAGQTQSPALEGLVHLVNAKT